ncbi:type 1 glutamine amidotransferase [Desulfospira joergensenii]|uniref:type 1 glutamine amidotransferase n=1 Tax=Desulfospira joergensenii TaxID=53329 RepID=UPI0003B42E06|nr:gamma-glutamyl-gamma-aminobutyrate hydrolase family protein [Desulfospira joergensenii]
MHAHYFQHVPFEGLGSIEPWLAANRYEITSTRFFKSAALPDPGPIDLLIVMGGPMGVMDEEEFPWLDREKDFIAEYIKTGKPVLGICLGAQLIASALGAKVYPNPQKEIGWFPINGSVSADPDLLGFPARAEVFHWHGDTFDLPEGAIRLAQSKACKNQAFQLGRSVVGLQFHLETTPTSLQGLVANCRDELLPSEFVQAEEKILSAGAEQYNSINQIMEQVLIFLTGARDKLGLC